LHGRTANYQPHITYPETRSNDKKALGGDGCISASTTACAGGRIACEPPSLTGAYQYMEKIDDVSPARCSRETTR
jgi:hypothetical protein